MNPDPVRVLRIDWSRKVRMACANGASAEPDVVPETGQLTGIVEAEVVVWAAELEVELELVVVVELIVVIVTATIAWIPTAIVMVWVSEPLAPDT